MRQLILFLASIASVLGALFLVALGLALIVKGNPAYGMICLFLGVHWYKAGNVWRAKIRHGDVYAHLGQFTNEIEAAKAYDKKAIELFGEFANPNFPE